MSIDSKYVALCLIGFDLVNYLALCLPECILILYIVKSHQKITGVNSDNRVFSENMAYVIHSPVTMLYILYEQNIKNIILLLEVYVQET